MLNSSLKTLFLSAALVCAGAVYAADDPSIHEVYAAAQTGHLADAQRMMEKVLQDHPDSAKAHFVEAELLAKQGQTARAAAELNKAETLEPGLPFAKPESVQHLKQIVGRTNYSGLTSGTMAPAHAQSSGISWIGILLGGGFIAMLIFGLRALFARRTLPNYIPASNSGYGPTGTGYGPMGQMPGGGGMGSGIMSGLATGAAVGAGMVAGEALAHHFLDGDERRHADNSLQPMNDNYIPDDMGGSDFGIGDNSSWDDGGSFGGDDNSW